MKKTFLIVAGILALIIGGTAIGLMTFDADQYRPQLVDMLEKKTGRTVALNGPIKLGISLHGVTLTIQDAAIGNPAWASRPVMASIAKFELGVDPLALLSHKIKISELQIINADIQLETSGDKHNWDIGSAPPETTVTTDNKPATAASSGINLNANNVLISDSQISIRDANGKTSSFKTDKLTYGTDSEGIAAHFEGSVNNTAVTIQLKTGTDDLRANKSWPLAVGISYGPYDITAKGTVNLVTSTATIESYTVSAGASVLSGQLNVNWGGSTPSIKGTLTSQSLNLADFQTPANTPAESTASIQQTDGHRILSDAPLPFDVLKSVDAALAISIDTMIIGKAQLHSVRSDLSLSNGHLHAPLKALLGKAESNSDLLINTENNPPQIQFTSASANIDLAELLAIAGAPAFLSGTADTHIALTTSGYSPHNLAGNLSGKIDVIATGGEVSSDNASGISSSLMKIFAPNGDSALNCLAARFTINSGILHDNGILVDSTATTIAGKGGANLGLETLAFMLHAKPKIISIGGVLPPLQVSGTFKHPSFDLNGSAIVENFAGVLTSGSLSGLTGDKTVPDIEDAPTGQNACVYTLDHPAAQTTSNNAPLLPGVSGQMQKLKGMGGELLKGLLGN